MTRNWYKFVNSSNNIPNKSSRFKITDFYLVEENKNFKERFNFEIFLKNELCKKIFNYLENKLDKKETLFIGSSWGWWEYFLNKKFNLTASDVNDEYVAYHNKNTNLKYIKLDILDINSLNKINGLYDQVVINNIEYLFNDEELKRSIKNISKITKKGSKIIVIFRSRDGLIQKLIDNLFVPLECYILYLLRSLKKKTYFNKLHHGFRRKIEYFIRFWENENFKFISLYQDMYDLEFSRLKLVQRLGISKLLSKICLNKVPYLNIIIFENYKEIE